MENSMISISVTSEELTYIAECSERMANYVEAGDGLLITTLEGEHGEEVRLLLDRSCIHSTSYDTS